MKNKNNSNNNARIMTKEGYNELLLEYAKLKVELTEIREEMNENILKGADEQSPSLQSLQARYNIKSGELLRISRKLENITIVNKIENDNLIDINDILTVSLETNGEEEVITVKIVEVLNDLGNDDIEPVLTNSPMGRALYGQALSEKREFQVNGNTMYVTALSKVEVKEKNKKNNPVRERALNTQNK